MLNITSINVLLLDERADSKIKAVASILLDNCFVVNSIKIIDGAKGIFVAMPSIKDSHGAIKDVVYPIDAKVHKELSNQILAAYFKKLEDVREGKETRDNSHCDETPKVDNSSNEEHE